MARKVYEGNVKVYWLTSVANIAAPTAAEIAAGKNLTPYVTKDGVALNMTQNGVDSSGIDSIVDTQVGGSVGAAPELTMYRDNASETNAWDLIIAGTQGFLLYFPFGSTAVGQKVQVYPSEMGEPRMANSATNTMERFSVNFFLTAPYNQKALVA